MVYPLSISALVSRAARAGAAGGAGLCVLQGRYGRPMACLSRFLGHWPKDGPAALADGRRSQALPAEVRPLSPLSATRVEDGRGF